MMSSSSTQTRWSRNRDGRLVRSSSIDRVRPRNVVPIIVSDDDEEINLNSSSPSPPIRRRSRRIANRRRRQDTLSESSDIVISENHMRYRSRSRSRNRAQRSRNSNPSNRRNNRQIRRPRSRRRNRNRNDRNRNNRHRQRRQNEIIILSDDDDDDEEIDLNASSSSASSSSAPQRRRSQRIANRRRNNEIVEELHDSRSESSEMESFQVPSRQPQLVRQRAFYSDFSSSSVNIRRMGRSYRMNARRGRMSNHNFSLSDEEDEDIEIMNNAQAANDALDDIIFLDDDDEDEINENILNIGEFLRLVQRRYAEIDPSERQRIINALPTRTLTEFDVHRKSCMICLNQFEIGDKVRTLLCFHQFHTECVDQWFQTKLACPICRFSIRSDDHDNVVEQ